MNYGVPTLPAGQAPAPPPMKPWQKAMFVLSLSLFGFFIWSSKPEPRKYRSNPRKARKR